MKKIILILIIILSLFHQKVFALDCGLTPCAVGCACGGYCHGNKFCSGVDCKICSTGVIYNSTGCGVCGCTSCGGSTCNACTSYDSTDYYCSCTGSGDGGGYASCTSTTSSSCCPSDGNSCTQDYISSHTCLHSDICYYYSVSGSSTKYAGSGGSCNAAGSGSCYKITSGTFYSANGAYCDAFCSSSSYGNLTTCSWYPSQSSYSTGGTSSTFYTSTGSCSGDGSGNCYSLTGSSSGYTAGSACGGAGCSWGSGYSSHSTCSWINNSAINDTVTLTKSPTVDLSSSATISFWVRSSRTGSFMRFQMGESSSSEQFYNITINSADTWEEKVWDISNIPTSSRNAIQYFAFKNIDDSSAFTFYFDDVQAIPPTPTPTPTNTPTPTPIPVNDPYSCTINESSNDTYLTPNWKDNSNDEDGFQIEKNTDGGGFTFLTNVGANITGYQDNSISANHTYTYRSRAFRIDLGSTVFSSYCNYPTLDLHTGDLNLEGLNIEGFNIN